MEQIEPYMLIRLKGMDWYFYLNIIGGSGHAKRGLGGCHKFYIYYAEGDMINHAGIDSEMFCKERGIPCGVGDTILDAYADFQKQLEKKPLK